MDKQLYIDFYAKEKHSPIAIINDKISKGGNIDLFAVIQELAEIMGDGFDIDYYTKELMAIIGTPGTLLSKETISETEITKKIWLKLLDFAKLDRLDEKEIEKLKIGPSM